MKTITLSLPDEVAGLFESLSAKQKSTAALLAAVLSRSMSPSASQIFESIDKRVSESGISSEEIDKLLEDIS